MTLQHRREVLSELKNKQSEDLASMRKQIKERQTEVRTRYPYLNWIREPVKPDYTIDSKGTTIFTSPDGGTIRDNGDEIYFSKNNQSVLGIAEKYAKVHFGACELRNGAFEPFRHKHAEIMRQDID